MWKNKIFFVVCLLYFYSIPTDGLKCYHCTFIQGNFPNSDQIKNDSSCELGSKPDSSLIVDCDDLDHVYGRPGGKRDSSDEKWEFSCLALNFKGKMETGSDIIFSTLSCLARPAGSGSRLEGKWGKCYSNYISEIGKEIREEEVKRLLVPLQTLFTNETQVGVCTCSGDNCNGYNLVTNDANNINSKAALFLFLAYILPACFN